jgi:hypothetical protein
MTTDITYCSEDTDVREAVRTKGRRSLSAKNIWKTNKEIEK